VSGTTEAQRYWACSRTNIFQHLVLRWIKNMENYTTNNETQSTETKANGLLSRQMTHSEEE
jgi:hypothetical protein